MPIQPAGSVRALALVGPTSAGKTTLLEALLQVTGTVDGGLGINRLDLITMTTSVAVDLSIGTASHTGGVGNIQNVDGGSGDD